MQARADGGGVQHTPASSRWSDPLGAALALLGLALLATALTFWVGSAPGWAYDFSAYYHAALRLVTTGSPYQAETLGGPFRPGPAGLYLYSPLPAILLVPLTALTEHTASLVWLGFRLAILGLTAALMPVPRWVRLATFGVAALSAPILLDLNLGNVSLIVTFLAVVTWRWLDRPLGSITIALSVFVRPTMALIAGWWLLRGLWRPVAWAAVAGLALVLASLPFYGVEPWLEYVVMLRNITDVTGVPRNVDLGSAVLHLGGPEWLASLALFAGYAVAVIAVLLSLRRDRELSFVVAVVATLWLAPLVWDHYFTHLLVPAAFLAARGRPWGLALPLLCWLPALFDALDPAPDDGTSVIFPLIALAALLLPFTAPDRGQPAGVFLDRLNRRPGARQSAAS